MSLSAAAIGVMQIFCNTLINLIGLVTFLIVEATGIISFKLLMIDYDCTGNVSINMATVYSALFFVLYGEDTMDFILDQFIGTEDYDAFINNTTHYSSEYSSVDVTPSSTLPVAAHDDLTPAAPTFDCCCPSSLIMRYRHFHATFHHHLWDLYFTTKTKTSTAANHHGRW